MPRQIIDTESSRPAYAPAPIAAIIVWSLVIVLVLAAAIWFLAHRAHGQETRAAGGNRLRSAFNGNERGLVRN